MLFLSELERIALLSRIVLFLFQVIINGLIPDLNPDVFNPPSDSDKPNLTDSIVESLLGGFRRWDSVYLLHVAEHGYTYENTLAFFPLFPILVRLIGNTLFYPLTTFLSYPNVLLVSAVCLNTVVFVKSAGLLRSLGVRVLGDRDLAERAVVMFCFNPASVFMSASYSESLFFYLTLRGLLLVESPGSSGVAGPLILGLSTATRSNGLVNGGYVAYRNFETLLRSITARTKIGAVAKTIIWISIRSSFGLLLVAIPWGLFQFYAYNIYCFDDGAAKLDIDDRILRYGHERSYKMPPSFSLWCYDKIPVSYSYVQDVHWDVGFLRYYRFEQIPNFILATPVIVLSICLIWDYAQRRTRYFLTFGIQGDASTAKKKTDVTVFKEFYADACYPYVVHLLFLLSFGIFFMHIQVLTRFLFSSCPVLYWYIARVTRSPPTRKTSEKNKETQLKGIIQQITHWNKNNFKTKLIFIYAIIYITIGTALHVNFLPWT
ncbi:GPI alpha-1,6-mannosyltransferase 2-like [Tubulanus polymorphus]|uniref:GPI alpha-1,6-mannosyltransferase 2-like n=1 Tax=Tubulanus polymorphus TaxID=672921 RepID=UPI003DA2B210